jgi:hypothetical protein
LLLPRSFNDVFRRRFGFTTQARGPVYVGVGAAAASLLQAFVPYRSTVEAAKVRCSVHGRVVCCSCVSGSLLPCRNR